MGVQLPPLSLYIHIPWCVRKCPYCDFNSHQARESLDAERYIDTLLADLSQDLKWVADRPLQTIFIGGGTPSLFSPASIRRLLAGVKARIAWTGQIEITLEANPGTLEADNFAGYRDAGVNRLSIGVQSFNPDCLHALGRIHGPDEAMQALKLAKQAGFDHINLDLMFGLPGQSLEIAKQDVSTALELDPGHISYYQLTLEPNTPFHHAPPDLPHEEAIWRMQEQGQRLLQHAGYRQYEISAFARKGQRCRHNLNYWTFGDYLGIGAGAHAKLTQASDSIQRTSKWRHPEDYLKKTADGCAIQGVRSLTEADRILEFMMNLLRLRDGFDMTLFTERTGLPPSSLDPALATALSKGLLETRADRISATPLGRRFLNDLLGLFVPDAPRHIS
jgi:oxygen-independent coproporphyrinogen-3 oxidase